MGMVMAVVAHGWHLSILRVVVFLWQIILLQIPAHSFIAAVTWLYCHYRFV
jgi:hypothetical protein